MNAAPPVQPGLSRGIRVAAVLGAMLCAFVGAFAGSEAMHALGLGETLAASTGAPAFPGATPELSAALEQMRHVALSTLRGMRVSRSLVLGLLSVSCALGFVASLRLMRPLGLPREGARRTLVFALLSSALLRTVDGAQQAVVVQRQVNSGRAALEALSRFALESQPEAAKASVETVQTLADFLQRFYFGGSIAFTVGMVGLFTVLGQIFRSERLRLRIAELDAQHTRPLE